MFVIANRCKVNPGFEVMFEELSLLRIHLIESVPGFLKWELHRPLGEGWYASLTYWESRAYHEAWRQSEAYRSVQCNQPPQDMFAAPEVLEMTEVVQSSLSPEAFLEAWEHALSTGDGRRECC